MEAEQGCGEEAEAWGFREADTVEASNMGVEAAGDSEEEEVAANVLVKVSKTCSLEDSRSFWLPWAIQWMCWPCWPKFLCIRKLGCWTGFRSLKYRLW
jgi:hypothetical protein